MLGYLGCSTWSKDVECHSMLPLLVQGSAGFSQMSYWTIQKLLRTTGGAACTCITVPMMLTVCANCFFHDSWPSKYKDLCQCPGCEERCSVQRGKSVRRVWQVSAHWRSNRASGYCCRGPVSMPVIASLQY